MKKEKNIEVIETENSQRNKFFLYLNSNFTNQTKQRKS